MLKSIGVSKRPIFIPNQENLGVIEQEIEFDWHMGMSTEVRKRSIKSLHQKAAEKGYKQILEASSKSDNEIGIQLSAFFLKSDKGIPVENIFQSSKVFEHGGPYLDLRGVTPREAKKDMRLKNSGNLLKFSLGDTDYPLEPKSLFYDWVYIKVLFSDKNLELREKFFDSGFDAFSDIEFNPKKSFSCQARTLALCTSLHKHESIKDFIKDPIGLSKEFNLYNQVSIPKVGQGELNL